LVICCVFLTDLMRRRISRRLAIIKVWSPESGVKSQDFDSGLRT
jgi:hypothetical protein